MKNFCILADDLKAVIEKDRLRREAEAKSKNGESAQAGIIVFLQYMMTLRGDRA